MPQDIFPKCSDFKVITCNDAVNMFDLHSIISAKIKCKPCAHSIISCSFQRMNHTLYENVNENVSTNTNANKHTNKKYKFDNVSPKFMNNEMW